MAEPTTSWPMDFAFAARRRAFWALCPALLGPGMGVAKQRAMVVRVDGIEEPDTAPTTVTFTLYLPTGTSPWRQPPTGLFG